MRRWRVKEQQNDKRYRGSEGLRGRGRRGSDWENCDKKKDGSAGWKNEMRAWLENVGQKRGNVGKKGEEWVERAERRVVRTGWEKVSVDREIMRNYTLWEERETESSISSHSTSYLCLLCKLLIISQSLLPFLFSPFVLYSNFWNKFCLIVSHLLHILPSLISISFYLCWSSFWSLFNLSSFLFPSMFSWAWSSLVISWTCVVHSLIFSPLSCSSLQFSFWISLTLVRSFAFYFFSLTPVWSLIVFYFLFETAVPV